MRPISEIIVHCTATRADWWATRSTNQKVAEIRRWHIEDRGWSDIGYHYLIDRNGNVATGRPIEKTGAHVQGHNTGTIGISLFGGHGSSENDAFEDHFTPEQDAALRQLIGELSDRYGIHKVTGHNQYAAKACPGFNVGRWLAGKTPARQSLLSSTTVQSLGISGASVAGGAWTVFGGLSETERLIVLITAGIAILGILWAMRERVKKWAAGVR